MTSPVVVLDRGNNTTCTVNLHGATVVSWRVNNQEQLFVSKRAVFDGERPIRGGIPFVFPVYGRDENNSNGGTTSGSPLPEHGFARVAHWSLERGAERLNTGDVEAIFTLADSEFTRSVWNCAFRLSYRLILREKELHMNVGVFNPSENFPFDFNLLFHTYIKCPDVRRCQVR